MRRMVCVLHTPISMSYIIALFERAPAPRGQAQAAGMWMCGAGRGGPAPGAAAGGARGSGRGAARPTTHMCSSDV